MENNKKYRLLARAQLGNDVFRNKWLTMLAVCCVVIFADMFLWSGPLSNFYIGPIFGVILGGPLVYGMTKAMLECARGERWSFTHILHGFTDCFGGSIILGFLEGLFIAVRMVLLIVPGIIAVYSYSMAFYIQCDYPEKEAIDCLHESCDMMKGNKWKLFCLDFSFFGWYLLGALCLGVGILFVVPYHEMARTNFYEALAKKHEAEMTEKMIAEMEAKAAELEELEKLAKE